MTAIVIIRSAEVDNKQWYTISVPPEVSNWIIHFTTAYNDHFRLSVSEFDVSEEVLSLIRLRFGIAII